MPNSASAKKRLKQSQERRLRNRGQRSNVRTQIKKVRVAVQAGDVETGEKEFRVAVKKLDQAAAKNLIHPNAAARSKSRLSQALKDAKAAS